MKEKERKKELDVHTHTQRKRERDTHTHLHRHMHTSNTQTYLDLQQGKRCLVESIFIKSSVELTLVYLTFTNSSLDTSSFCPWFNFQLTL